MPTFLLLAHSLQRGADPLVAACQFSGLANTSHKLLSGLNRLGRRVGGRALLVIDGINEGDRKAWRRHMPWVINVLRKFPNVALILSCRTPFDNQILSARSRGAFVQLVHTGLKISSSTRSASSFGITRFQHRTSRCWHPSFLDRCS